MSRRAWLLAALLVVGAPGAARAAENPPSAELAAALRSLGAPGLLWGRLAVEEESPEGPWTPLAGVEVTVYPYLPAVATELDRIRRSARDALSQYETAVARIQELLRRHGAEVDAARRDIAGMTEGDDSLVKRRVTDATGAFVFEDLPSGEWLFLAMRITPYSQGKEGAAARRPARPREPRFVPRSGVSPAKSAEVWVARVRLGATERVRLLLTDRARFLTGPVAGEAAR